MNLFQLIASDIAAKSEWLYESRRTRAILKCLLTDGTPAMIWYRLMHWARSWHLTPLELIFNRINSGVCGCVIGRGAEFGPGFVLIHANGIVINGNVRGGCHVKLEHQVTIGAEKRQSPILGNDVFLGAGAKVIGSETASVSVRMPWCCRTSPLARRRWEFQRARSDNLTDCRL